MDEHSDDQRNTPRGDSEHFVTLFAKHEPALRAFLRPMVYQWDDLNEVLQQASLAMLRKFSEFEQGTDFLSWACTVARFEVLKFRRSKARDRHVFSDELIALLADEGAAEVARRERERRALDQCIERLEPTQRELIRRCYSGEKNIGQVAESLGRSATGLYKALNRIRQMLLECIQRSLAQEATP